MTTITAESTFTKQQYKSFGPKAVKGYGANAVIWAHLRYDDECGNGHNSFAITGSVKKGREDLAGGCLHEDIATVFPELAPLIKWHLCSSDGPMHYIANTVYWVKQGNLDYARNSAIWPEASEHDLQLDGLATRLQNRLPQLLQDFRNAMEIYGFVW